MCGGARSRTNIACPWRAFGPPSPDFLTGMTMMQAPCGAALLEG
jgi:hypothetical protein